MPPAASSVPIQVANAAWVVQGEVIYVQNAGYFSVNVVSVNNIIANNLGYAGNATPFSVIGVGQQVGPGGLQGPTVTLDSLSPTTTKGDLIVDNGANNPNASDVRLGVGTNGQVPTADSSQTTGIAWKPVDLTGASTSLSGQLQITNGGTGAATQAAALNNLMPPSAAAGDIVYFNGTNWTRLILPTKAFEVLRANAGLTALEYAFQGLLQTVVATKTTQNSTASGITFSTSAPTTGAGLNWLTASITPRSTGSKVKITASAMIDPTAGAYIALFNGTTLLNVAATTIAGLQQMTCEAVITPGSVTPITIALYVGTSGSGTTYINSTAGVTSNFLGTTPTTYLKLEEIQ